MAMELASAAASCSVTSGLVSESWLDRHRRRWPLRQRHCLGWLAAAPGPAVVASAAALVAEVRLSGAAMVRPALVAANRSDLVIVVTSSFFGPECSGDRFTIEAAYEQMWAIDIVGDVGLPCRGMRRWRRP